MSERNDSAAGTGKPAEERGEPARDRQPDPQAASTAGGPTGTGEASGPAVPGESEDAKPAASAPAAAQGDALRDEVTPQETGDAEPATKNPPAAAEDAAEQVSAQDTTAKDAAAKGSSGTTPSSGDASGAGAAKAEPGEDAKTGEDGPDAGKPGADVSDAGTPDAGAGAEKTAAAGQAARVTATDRPEAPEPGEEDDEPKIQRFDCAIPEQRAAGLEAAADAVRQGKLVVIPTDTVYGIGADAFTPSAVNALLAAKGRGRDMPVPVLVGTVRAANALVDDIGPYGQDLIDAFWPGPLTIIGHAGRSLRWDLGETKGTVALRMPLHSVALDLLKETGPMAVSSANRSGAPPATTIAEAEEQLGDSVAVYLDGGRCTQPIPSTIVDLTTPVPRVLRKGAISVEKLKSIVGYVATDD